MGNVWDEFRWEKGVFGHDVRLPVISGMVYLCVIFSLQRIMANKKPLDLRFQCAAHNGLLFLFSLIMFLGQTYEFWAASQVFCDKKDAPPSGKLFFWSYIFYVSKYYELLDTIFLVLKKKPLDFLHVYHHAIVPTGCWLGFAGWKMPVLTGCIFNSAVHVVMYYYFAVSQLGYTVWWKKYITVFQIVQFCSGGVFTVCFYALYFRNISIVESGSSYSLTFTKGCSGNLLSVILVACINLSFLFLFISFYLKTYTTKKSRSTSHSKQN